MTQEEKDTALGQINLMKLAFHHLYIQLPHSMCFVGGTAQQLEVQIRKLEQEVKNQEVTVKS